LLAALAANLLIPLAFALGASQALRLWHDPDEARDLLVGLALVACMPVAGSSTAWAQQAEGSMRLSLGLVLLSTLLSPLTTPVALSVIGRAADGRFAEALDALGTSGASVFLILCVVLPSVLGVLTRQLAGETRFEAARPHLKLTNALTLLLLIYANACAALPGVVAC